MASCHWNCDKLALPPFQHPPPYIAKLFVHILPSYRLSFKSLPSIQILVPQIRLNKSKKSRPIKAQTFAFVVRFSVKFVENEAGTTSTKEGSYRVGACSMLAFTFCSFRAFIDVWYVNKNEILCPECHSRKFQWATIKNVAKFSRKYLRHVVPRDNLFQSISQLTVAKAKAKWS